MTIYHNHPPGVSLIIAIIFVSALMYIIASLAETTINSYKNIQNWQNFTRSETTADTLLWQARSLAGRYDAGWSVSDSWESGDPLPDPETPTGFVLASVIAGLKGMKGICPQGGAGGALEPCGDISFRYDVIGSPAEPLDFPGAGTGYPAMAPGGCNFEGRENCYYVIPAPIFIDRDDDGENDVIAGSGDLTKSCDFDLDGDGDIDDTDKLNGENPCHWNKLTLGKLIEIPLYLTDSYGTIINPVDLYTANSQTQTLTEFKLRIRTPCQFTRDDGTKYYDTDQWCASNLRIELYPENRSGIPCDPDTLSGRASLITDPDCKNRTSAEDKQLVRWEIQFENSDDPAEPYSLLAMDDPVSTYWQEPTRDGERRIKNPTPPPYNSEIYASKITKEQFAVARGQDAIVLTNIDIGFDVNKYWDNIERFYKGNPARNNLVISGVPPAGCPNNWDCADRSINKPKLRLELIYRPRLSSVSELNTTPVNVVPYLEYQILTNRPIGDEKKTIRTEARVSGTGSTMKTRVYNPVIQQSFVVEN